MHKLILALGGAALLLAGCSTMDEGGHMAASGEGGHHAADHLTTRKADLPRKAAMTGAGIAPIGSDEADHYMAQQQADLRAQLAGTGVTVTRVHETLVLSMPSDITFGKSSADIEAKAFPILTTVATVLDHYSATYVDIVGHADSSGTAAANKALSEKRANATAGYLVDHKIKSERIYVAGLGDTQPVASNDTPEGRAKNRRVDITLRPMVAG